MVISTHKKVYISVGRDFLTPCIWYTIKQNTNTTCTETFWNYSWYSSTQNCAVLECLFSKVPSRQPAYEPGFEPRIYSIQRTSAPGRLAPKRRSYALYVCLLRNAKLQRNSSQTNRFSILSLVGYQQEHQVKPSCHHDRVRKYDAEGGERVATVIWRHVRVVTPWLGSGIMSLGKTE
jgi:hypothetical protein